MTDVILTGGLAAAIILIALLYRRVRALEHQARRAQSEREKLHRILEQQQPQGRHRRGGPQPARTKNHLSLYIGGLAAAIAAGADAVRQRWRPAFASLALAALTGATAPYAFIPGRPSPPDPADPGLSVPDPTAAVIPPPAPRRDRGHTPEGTGSVSPTQTAPPAAPDAAEVPVATTPAAPTTGAPAAVPAAPPGRPHRRRIPGVVPDPPGLPDLPGLSDLPGRLGQGVPGQPAERLPRKIVDLIDGGER